MVKGSGERIGDDDESETTAIALRKPNSILTQLVISTDTRELFTFYSLVALFFFLRIIYFRFAKGRAQFAQSEALLG